MRRSTSPYDTLRGFESARARGVKWKPDKEFKAPDPAPYTSKEALTWWNSVQKDFWWQSQMPISKEAIDAVFGRGAMRRAFNPNRWGSVEKYMARMAMIIDDIEDRELVFPRTVFPKGSRFKKDMKFVAPKFLRIPVSEEKIGKLVAESFWSLHARCLSCENNKFLPVEIDAKPYVACYHCINPSQYGQIGAKPVKRSLIQEALKKYY